MALDGECIYEIFFRAVPPRKTKPPLNLPKSKIRDCCEDMLYHVLASDVSTDAFENDRKGFDFFFPDVVNTAAISLYKYNKTSKDYQLLTTFVNDAFGVYYPFGSYVNSNGETFIGYVVSWKQVLLAYGEGTYKVRCDFEVGIGSDGFIDSDEYCLHTYTPERANNTVKIEYYRNGIMGDTTDDTLVKDYGTLNFYDSYRLKGYFAYKKSQYEKDYTRYNEGQRVWVKDEQEPEYTMELKPVSFKVHDAMRSDVLQADNILITDYNKDNFGAFIQKQVQSTSEYAPNFFINRSKLASVKLTFRQGINRFKRYRY